MEPRIQQERGLMQSTEFKVLRSKPSENNQAILPLIPLNGKANMEKKRKES